MLFNDFDKALDRIREQYHEMQERAAEAQQRVAEFRKDDEIRAAVEETNYIRRHALTVLSDKEFESARAFRNKHYELHKSDTGFFGNKYIYTLTGTGIGTGIDIKCPVCGEEEDITDYEGW